LKVVVRASKASEYNTNMDTSNHGGLWRRASVKAGIRRVSLNAVFPPWFFKGTKYVKAIGESTTFICFMVVLALFSIFSDDIRLACTNKSADRGFEAVTTIIFFSLLFEILMTCYYKEDYMTIPSIKKRSKDKGPPSWKSFLKRCRFGSFYFWLDLIAAFSLVVEVSAEHHITLECDFSLNLKHICFGYCTYRYNG
jgi:hypothetical protein